jgi:D-glycero-D-manno-heptose 1,7-bisphosphate phosphatase
MGRPHILDPASMKLGKSTALRFLFGRLPSRGRRPAIFLDRDGVINERVAGGFVTSWDEFRFLPRIPQALAELSRLRLPLIVVSNQAGVSQRLIRPSALRNLTERFTGALAQAGARIDAVYYCPHAPDDGCRCRKPRPGLLLEAARDWRLDLRRSVLIGDSARDLEVARAAGCRSLLLRAGKAPASPPDSALGAAVTVDDVCDLPLRVASLLTRSPLRRK